MLKADTRNGVNFLARQCQKPGDFGKWARFSLKIRWANDESGWVTASCDNKVIYAAEGEATNQLRIAGNRTSASRNQTATQNHSTSFSAR